MSRNRCRLPGFGSIRLVRQAVVPIGECGILRGAHRSMRERRYSIYLGVTAGPDIGRRLLTSSPAERPASWPNTSRRYDHGLPLQEEGLQEKGHPHYCKFVRCHLAAFLVGG